MTNQSQKKKKFLISADSSCSGFITYPTDNKYLDSSIREFQGIPTIAITKKGRIFVGFYSGGNDEPHPDNFNILEYSDNNGDSWTKPVLVIPSSREMGIHSFDIQTWVDSNNILYVTWIQDDMVTPGQDGYGRYTPMNSTGAYFDKIHTTWFTTCSNPDAETLIFSKPQKLFAGFLRNKPITLKNGRTIYPAYDTRKNVGYLINVSDDNGKTFKRIECSKKYMSDFDEVMCYQALNGDVVLMARTMVGSLAKCVSKDNGETWNKTILTDIKNPCSRFYIGRTPSGRLLLINNDAKLNNYNDYKDRSNLTAFLSDDDGKTFTKMLIDGRKEVSYPDVSFYNGKIYLIYDRERYGAKEVLMTEFSEEDIISGNCTPKIKVIAKV